MQKPLVPIDGSESAMRALSHAIAELRDRAGVQVHLLNVQTPPVHTFPGKLVPPDLFSQELRREGQAVLDQAQAVVQSAGLLSVCHVRIGRPGEEIAACAAEQDCDAVVMGTRGMGAAAGLLLAFLAVPSLTRSSLGELRYWVDWANLLAIAAGAGAAVLAFAWPLLAMRGRRA